MDTKDNWLRRTNERIATGFDRILLHEFNVLNDHQEFAATSILNKQKALEKEVARMVHEMNEEEKAEYYEYMQDEHHYAMESLPRLQWYAQFLIVYSTFEHSLNELCRIVQRRSHFTLSFKDLEGLGITRARNYLVKVAGVDTPFETSAWARAKLLGEIRNAIAHRNGEIDFEPKNPKSLSARLIGQSHLTLKQIVADQEDAQIVLSENFIVETIAVLRSVVADVCNFKLYAQKSPTSKN